jgi:trigger factor
VTTTPQKELFTNDKINVIVTSSGCDVKFEITLLPQATQKVYTQAIKIVKKEISLPGFRKGKAPDYLINEHYLSHINTEFRNLVVQEAFDEALKETKIYPLTDKSVKKPQLKNASKDEGALVVIEFECSPQIPTIDTKDVVLKKIEKESVTPEKIEKAIEDIRHHHATTENVTDRPIQEGDFVDLDIDAIDNPAHNICSNTRFHVVKGEMSEWMRKLIIGLSVNDSIEGMSEKELDDHDHVHTEHCKHDHEEFKPTLCRLTVKSINVSTLHPVDEELAKKVGVPSIDVLEERIKANLEKQFEDSVNEDLRQQIENLLLEKYQFAVPSSLIEDQYKTRLTNTIKGLRKQGESEESIKNRIEEIKEEVRQKTSDDLRFFFIARKVASEHDFQVTQAELYKEMSRQMWVLPVEESIIDASMKPEEVQSRLYWLIIGDKAKDYLIQQAKVL